MPSEITFTTRALAAWLVGCLAAIGGPALRAQCDTLIAAENIEVDYRGQPVQVCLEVDYDFAVDAERFLDGEQLSGTAPGCNFDTLVRYPYANLLAADESGPYRLDRWSVGDERFSGDFADVPGLVDLLNDLDPEGAWADEPLTQNIVGGASGRRYGSLTATPEATGRPVVVNRNLERRAGGTAVSVDGAGYHEFVLVDPASGCRDTVLIFLRPELTDAEVRLTTAFDTPTEEFCAATDGLIGTPSTFTICEAPSDGTLVNTEGFCFVYEPDPGSTGTDIACIEVCDDTPPPYGPVCRRTRLEVIVRNTPSLSRDTARFTISNADTVVCLDEFVDVLRPYDRVELCAPQPEGLRIGLGELNESPCVTLLPEAMYEGLAEACVAYCTAGDCDTTVLQVSVGPRCFADVFAAPVDTVADEGDPTLYCIPLARADAADFDISIDGERYAGPLRECAVETRFSYDFGPVVTDGEAPFRLVDWFVNGRSFNGAFDSLPELELLVRERDPSGAWRLNPMSLAIRGGAPEADYGDMQITDANGVTYVVTPDPFGVTVGVSVPLPGAGTYELTLVERDVAGCADQVTVVVGGDGGSDPSVPDTASTASVIEVVLDSGMVSDVFCLFGDRTGDLTLLREATNGFLTDAEQAGYCYTYTPNVGFVGMDTVVAVSCQPGGSPCDTTTAIITVQAPPRPAGDLAIVTIPIRIVGDAPYTACVTGLDIARPYTEADVIAVSGPFAAEASPQNGCVLIDPTGPEAATGRVEVLFCESADPARCQTVIFDIRQIATCADGPFTLESEILDPSDDPVDYCLADGADLAVYEIRVNDVVADTRPIDGCGGGGGGGEGEVREVSAYSVINLEDTDYRIDAWDVNGDALIRLDTRGGFQGVADSMSAFDPDRDWFYDAELGVLHTTDAVGNYSPVLSLFDYRFGTSQTLRLTTAEVTFAGDGSDPDGAPGSAVTLPGPGTYVIEAYNPGLQCGDRITVVVPPATLPDIDTITIVVEEGRRNGPFCVPTDELPGAITAFEFCGEPTDGTARVESAGCFTYRADGFTGFDQLCVVACTENPTLCDTTIYVIDVRASLPACPDIFADDVFSASVEDCDGPTAVCLPPLPTLAANYTLSIAGVNQDAAEVCGSAEVTIYDYAAVPGGGLEGPYRVSGIVIAGETFDVEVADMATLADSLNDWDATGRWSQDFAERRILGGAPGQTYASLAVTQLASGDQVTLTPDRLTIDNRLSVELMPGSYRIIATDRRTSCSDTLDVTIECGCPQVLPRFFSRGVDCQASTVEVCLPLPIDTLAAYTLTVDGAVYSGPTEACDARTEFVIDELELYAVPPGEPLTFNVDSITIDGDVYSAEVTGAADLAAQLDEWDQTAGWRYDDEAQLIRGGNPATDYSSLFISAPLIEDSGPREIVLEPTTTPAGTSIRIPAGAGERAITLDDGDGCVQEVVMTLVCVQTGVATDTVDVNGTVLYCVDESELTGRVDTLFNACPEAGGAVEFNFNAPLGCVSATGLAPGTSTACLVACDVNGVCDTTLYTVVVNPTGESIDAVNDTFRLRVDETLRVSVTDNDAFGALTSLVITSDPTRGTANLSADGVLTYTPIAGDCGFTDSLRYELCSGQTCDEATVYLRVRCGAVEVYSGFSPNGDGLNDVFYIEGIGEFPDAEVRVYNRWGNLVFEAENGYDNDWEATWDGNRLPAGTYFYLVEVPGEDEQSGYVQVWR